MKATAKNLYAFLVLSMVAGLAAAQATMPTGLSESIADAIAVILLIIATGGAGMLTIALAKVGWNVGAKFIARLGSKG